MFVSKQMPVNKRNKNEDIFRVSIATVEEARKWLEEYQRKTRTQWKVSKTFPDPERYMYRSIWVCSFNKKNLKDNSRRNTDCKATLEIKIKKITKDTKKKDPYIGKEDTPLPAIITIKNVHNHMITCSDSLRYMRGDETLRNSFYSYFNDGMTPAETIRLHQDKLMLEERGIEKLADGHLNPSDNTVYYWHRIWRQANFSTTKEPLSKLEEKITQYEKVGVRIAIKKDSPWVVALATPVMQRAQALPLSSEIIFVDSTSTCDHSSSSVTVMLTVTKVGAIPIGVLVHETQTKDCYKEGFELFGKTFVCAFGGKQSPAVLMTDDSTPEKDALSLVWKEAVQLLSHFHVAQQEWRWVLDSKNKVKVEDRKKLMKAFQNIMYSTNSEEFDSSINNFKKISHDGYKTRIENFLNRKEKWVRLFRNNLIMCDHDTINFAEATIRVLKNVILQRVKAYSITALVDCIVNVWDRYLVQRLLKTADNSTSEPFLLYDELLERCSDECTAKIQNKGETVYTVPSSNTSLITFEVDIEIGQCSCKVGVSGAFCKHQAAVHSKFGGGFPNAPPLSSNDRVELGQLALGEECPCPELILIVTENQVENPCEISRSEICLKSEEAMDVDRSEPLKRATEILSSPSRQECFTLEADEMDDTHFDSPTTALEVFSCSSREESLTSEIETRATTYSKSARNPTCPDQFDAETQNHLISDFQKEWERIHQLSANNTNYIRCLEDMTKSMRKIETATIATAAMVQMATALRRENIKVQPTSVQRRRGGVTKGSKRIPAVRSACGSISKPKRRRISR